MGSDLKMTRTNLMITAKYAFIMSTENLCFPLVLCKNVLAYKLKDKCVLIFPGSIADVLFLVSTISFFFLFSPSNRASSQFIYYTSFSFRESRVPNKVIKSSYRTCQSYVNTSTLESPFFAPMQVTVSHGTDVCL